jgi:hypothetical protein
VPRVLLSRILTDVVARTACAVNANDVEVEQEYRGRDRGESPMHDGTLTVVLSEAKDLLSAQHILRCAQDDITTAGE